MSVRPQPAHIKWPFDERTAEGLEKNFRTLFQDTTFLATGNVIPVSLGGTGLTTFDAGDVLYAPLDGVIAGLPVDTTAGRFLRTDGALPEWSTLVLPDAATTGDLLYASATSTISRLADVATGNALISGGVGVAPSWGKIGLTTHVSGVLPIANGGTNNSSAYTAGSIIFSDGTSLTQDNSNLFWDNANNDLLLGTTSTPMSSLSLQGRGFFLSKTGAAEVAILAAGTSIFSGLRLSATGGTVASPSATQSGQGGFVSMQGYGTAHTFAKAAISLYAAENWTGSAQGTRIGFELTPTSSTTRTERIRIQPSGGLSIGNAMLSTDPGEGGLALDTALNVIYGGTGTDTQFTAGSVVFAGGSGIYAQDNANLFWDDTTNFLNVSNVNVASGGYYKYNSVAMVAAQTALNNYFFGPGGNLTMTGIQNTSIGENAFLNNTTGSNNTAIGFDSLRYNTTGTWNVAIGLRAMQGSPGLSTGSFNMALGTEALKSNLAGANNVAIGTKALTLNQSGESNVGIGTEALQNLVNGYYSVAIGERALFTSSDGDYNVAIGLYAQYFATTADQNTSIGAYSSRYNVTGTGNAVIGYKAGEGVSTNSYSNNSIVGFQSGQALTTGSNNILLGYQAGDNLTSGGTNIIIGYNTDAPSATSANVLALGNLLFGNGLDGTGTIVSAGNLAIGTTAFPSTGTWGLFFGDGTAPATMGSNTAGLYADDVGGTVEMFGIGEGGNTAQLTGLNIRKAADESVTNSTTHQADDHLTVNLAASSSYAFEIYGFWTTAGATAGITVQLDGTAGVSSLKADVIHYENSADTYTVSRITAFNSAVGQTDTGDNSFCIKGVIKTSTAGTMFLEWAQNAADAVNATTLQENSYFILRKLNA